MPFFSSGDGRPKWRSRLVVVVTVGIAAAVSAGIAAAATMITDRSSTSDVPKPPLRATPGVIHAPPDVAEPGETLQLQFTLDGPVESPDTYSGTLVVGGAPTPMTNSGGVFTVSMSVEVADVSYYAEFRSDDDMLRWPEEGTNPVHVLALPAAGVDGQQALAAETASLERKTVFSAGWGKTGDGLGVVTESSGTYGPAGFDVDDEGTVYIVDQANGRLLVAPTDREPRSIPVDYGVPRDVVVLGGEAYILEEAPEKRILIVNLEEGDVNEVSLGNDRWVGTLETDGASVYFQDGHLPGWVNCTVCVTRGAGVLSDDAPSGPERPTQYGPVLVRTTGQETFLVSESSEASLPVPSTGRVLLAALDGDQPILVQSTIPTGDQLEFVATIRGALVALVSSGDFDLSTQFKLRNGAVYFASASSDGYLIEEIR